jgi:hypothetical protein
VEAVAKQVKLACIGLVALARLSPAAFLEITPLGARECPLGPKGVRNHSPARGSILLTPGKPNNLASTAIA